jgi:transposase
MKKNEREEVAKRVVTHHINVSNYCTKSTVFYFVKLGITRSTIYRILTKYAKHEQTSSLPKSGRLTKISDKQLKMLVKAVNNKTGISQRRLGRRFDVAQSTISRILKKRTDVRILKRTTAPKYTNEEQQQRAQSYCLKVYRLLTPGVQLIMDDEKYFSLTGDINSNRSYYTTDSSTAPNNVKFKCRTKFEPKLLVWMAVSQKGISSVYIHRSQTAVGTETYLNKCIRKRLIPLINQFHPNDSILFWPDLATAHYAQKVQQCLTDHGISYVQRRENPPNVPQARPIEKIWAQLKEKIYENNWEAQNLNQLARRILKKVKEFDQNVVTHMILSVKKNLLKIYRKGVYSIC